MACSLDRVTIKGLKSIKSLENFELRNLNVLIGGNGAGKSNFIDFFRLLRAMMGLPLPNLNSTNLNTFVRLFGGSNFFLFNGSKVTQEIEAQLFFGGNGYRFKLVPTADETFLIIDEESYFEKRPSEGWRNIGNGNPTPQLLYEKDQPGFKRNSRSVEFYIFESISLWEIYHFHDTSFYSPMRRSETIYDNDYLRFDGANIAPYLLYLWEAKNDIYRDIVKTIRLVAPFFEDFILKPDSNENVKLLWKQRNSNYPLKAHHLSDGLLRFICLTTALLQPSPPSTYILDEPELGLHPFAIAILAELIEVASRQTQVIVATQSPTLVNYFEPKDIVTVNRKDGASTFQRLDKKRLSGWLKDYSLGELWQKGVISGDPVHE